MPKLTKCCGARSTYMDAGNGEWILCCKACAHEVQPGEGDE